MSSSLLWRSQVAVHPAVSIGLHRVGADLSLVDEATFDASQSPVLKTGPSCGNTLDFHARLAFETTRPRRRPMRWRGRLRIGQQCLPWNAAGALSNSLSPMKCRWRSSDGVVCAAPGAGCWSILLVPRKLRGPRGSGSVSHNHDDGDDKDCRDQRKRAIECFRARRCGGHFERRHDMTPSAHLLPRPASFCRNQSLAVGRSAEQARLLERLGPRRPGRHLTRCLEGIRRSRVLAAIIG